MMHHEKKGDWETSSPFFFCCTTIHLLSATRCSMPYFFASLKLAITHVFVGATVSERNAANEGARRKNDHAVSGWPAESSSKASRRILRHTVTS
jgi:hypothetical protein